MTENGSTRLTVDDVVTETDVFRLAIRGFAVIEESITMASQSVRRAAASTRFSTAFSSNSSSGLSHDGIPL